MKTLMVGLFLLAFLGCVTAPPVTNVWMNSTPERSNQAQFNSDLYDCNHTAKMELAAKYGGGRDGAFRTSWAETFQLEGMINQCMQYRGWYISQQY